MKFVKACLIVLIFGLSSCLNTKGVDPNICRADENTPISFKNDVMPIIKRECLQCHDSKNHFDGLVFETYQQVYSISSSGEFYSSIISINGYLPRMPKGGKLSDCELSIIKKWIDQKMSDN